MTAALAPDITEPQPFPTELWLRNVGIFLDEWRDIALLVLNRGRAVEMLQQLADDTTGNGISAVRLADYIGLAEPDHPDERDENFEYTDPAWRAYYKACDVERWTRHSLLPSLTAVGFIEWETGPSELPAHFPAHARERHATSYAHLTDLGRAWLTGATT